MDFQGYFTLITSKLRLLSFTEHVGFLSRKNMCYLDWLSKQKKYVLPK